MRIVLHHDDPRALDAALRERGVPDEVEMGSTGEGPYVVVVIAQGNRVADAAARWLRRHPLPEGFIVGCTPATRADCQPEAWWPASLCDMVLARDDDLLLDEIARRVARLAEMESILDSE